MTRLVRPYIPVRVRCEVIARQLQRDGHLACVLLAEGKSLTKALRFMLSCAFSGKVHLDHDPPLGLREIIDAEAGKYVPDANDPRYLIYRTKEDHHIKTFVRGDGAQLSDAGKRRKEIRRKKKLAKPGPWLSGYEESKALQAIDQERSRWPAKGTRKLRSRPLQWKPR